VGVDEPRSESIFVLRRIFKNVEL